jgi:protein-S-isoprenylcysteine O-methyltransferase Ste14
MGDWRLIVYGALWWLVWHVTVMGYEEPTLEQTFGTEYEAFRAAVPRWIPRMPLYRFRKPT